METIKLSLGAAGLVLGVLAVGCSASSADEVQTGDDQNQTAQGQTECKAQGYDCGAAGSMCTAKCYDTDARPSAFVKFAVGGKTLDSRSVPYAPHLSLDHVQVYGCDLWDFSDKTHQGLAIQYRRLIHGAATPAQKSDFEDDAEIYVRRFLGPGRYAADARYVASDDAEAAGQIYAAAGACSIDVASDGSGGVKGSFSCASVAGESGGSVAISGEFACGGSALAPIFSKLPE